jgi:hypothetical protein
VSRSFIYSFILTGCCHSAECVSALSHFLCERILFSCVDLMLLLLTVKTFFLVIYIFRVFLFVETRQATVTKITIYRKRKKGRSDRNHYTLSEYAISIKNVLISFHSPMKNFSPSSLTVFCVLFIHIIHTGNMINVPTSK